MDEKTNRKGCSYNLGLYIVVIVLVFWIITGIGLLTNKVTKIEGLYILLSALIPLGSLILSWYKQRIGGLLIIFSGFSPIIILINIPSLKSDDFYGIGLMLIALLVTLPLCIAGIIITSAKQKKREPPKEAKPEETPPEAALLKEIKPEEVTLKEAKGIRFTRKWLFIGGLVILVIIGWVIIRTLLRALL